ncbi:hypothetical protein ACFL1H_05460 [Nanoarchaeota archaeon]
MKRGRKALIQTDWIISLAIFLIFIGWFFGFLRPIMIPETTSPFLNLLENNFDDDTKTIITKLPIYLNSTQSSLEPIIINVNYNESQSSFLDNRHLTFNNKLLSYGNLGEYEYLYISNNAYTRRTESFDIMSNSQQTTMTDLILNFTNSLIENIEYKASLKADNINYNISGTPSYDSSNFVAQYTTTNHDSYVFANFTRIYSTITNPIEITMDLDPYTFVYDGSSKAINYSLNQCETFTNNFIDFYNGDGIAIISDNLEGRFCYDNTNKLNLSLTISNDYTIAIHEGNYNNIIQLDDQYTPFIGVEQYIEGYSTELLDQLENSNYNQKKTEWNLQSSNFLITITNITDDSTIFEYGQQPLSSNIKTTEYYDYLVDEYGNKEEVKVNLRIG